MDIFSDMGLTPEQGECLVANVGTVDMNDLTALMDLMTQCGISTDQLLQIGQDAAPTTDGAADTPTTAAAAPPGTLDCSDSRRRVRDHGPRRSDGRLPRRGRGHSGRRLTTNRPSSCSSGVASDRCMILDAIVALHEQTGATAAETTTTVAGAPATTVAAVGNPMVDLLLEQLAAQGITLDATQGQCLLDNIADFDPNDMASVIGACWRRAASTSLTCSRAAERSTIA